MKMLEPKIAVGSRLLVSEIYVAYREYTRVLIWGFSQKVGWTLGIHSALHTSKQTYIYMQWGKFTIHM